MSRNSTHPLPPHPPIAAARTIVPSAIVSRRPEFTDAKATAAISIMIVITVQGVRVELLGPLLGQSDAYATPPESIDGKIGAVLDPMPRGQSPTL